MLQRSRKCGAERLKSDIKKKFIHNSVEFSLCFRFRKKKKMKTGIKVRFVYYNKKHLKTALVKRFLLSTTLKRV